MRQLFTILGYVVLSVVAVRPCFAMGSFAVTSLPIGNFAGWAGTTNAKLLVGDFNGDGRADVAISGPSGWSNLPVAFSNGDGTFNVTNSPAGNFLGWSATANAKILLGDFNGDGKADLAITGPTSWNNIPVAFSNGDGTFNVTNQPITSFQGWAAVPNVTPLVGDFNADGKTDLALTGNPGWNTLPVAFSNGDGTFNVVNDKITNFAGWAATANAKPLVGDYNGDGKADVAVVGPTGWNNMPVAFSNGDGTFNVTNNPVGQFNIWAATANAKPLVGDFNGDGKTDLALTGPTSWNNLPVAFSNGDGTFNVTNQPISSFNGWAATANAKPLVGDFNGDHLFDIALTGPGGWSTLPVAFSNGDGTFNVTNQPIVDFATWASTSNATPLVGDFNDDGRIDVALSGPSTWSVLPVAFSLSSPARVVNMVPASLSGETNQDSEPFLALNPDFPYRMAGTAFTPNPSYSPSDPTQAPIYLSENSGFSWELNFIVPSNGAMGTSDITVLGTSDPTSNRFYSGILSVPGSLQMKELTTTDFTASTVMTTQSSRGQVDQPFVQGLRNGSTDRVFVGNNDLNAAPATATVDVTNNGGTTWNPARIEKRPVSASCGQNGPSIRPAVAPDGTIYAAFFHCHTWTSTMATMDVVVVRDDSWGSGSTPFTALIDPGDSIAGMRVVTNINIPWINGPALGNQRIGSTLSLAVDPNNSSTVYVAWADQVGTGDIYTIHVRSSINRGVTWSRSDLFTVTNATNVALAIGNNGTVGLVYQQVTGTGTDQRWITNLVQTRNDFGVRQYTTLASVPATAPTPTFQPYLGDYIHLIAVGSNFQGVFSANNTPNLANFPTGVIYQRQVNFSTQTLFNGTTPVAASIDPFFFSIPMLTPTLT